MAIITQQLFGVHATQSSINNEKEHFYNPFSIQGATENFSKSKDPLAWKIFTFAIDVFKDLTIYNPYKMSIGNIEIAFKNRHVQKSLIEKACYYTEVTILVLGSLVYMASLTFLGGAVLKGSGFALEKLSSSSLVSLGKILSNSGEFIQQRIAKTLFLSGTVPLYAAFYRLPKWIITSALPAGAKIVHKYLKALADVLEKVVKTIFDRFIVPCARMLNKMLIFLWNHVIVPVGRVIEKVLDWAVARIVEIVRWTWNSLIVPFFEILNNAIRSLINHVIVPVGRIIGKGLKWIISRTSEIVRWTWNSLIIPFFEILNKIIRSLFNHVVVPLLHTLKNGLEWTVNRIADLIIWTFDHVVNPLLNGLGSLSEFLWRSVIVPLWNHCSEVTSTIIRLAQNYFFSPLWQVIKESSSFVWKYAVQPLGKCLDSTIIFLSNKIASLSSGIFHNMIEPVAQAFSNAATQLSHFISESSSSLYNAISRVYSAIFA
jgi:hypothetical protein